MIEVEVQSDRPARFRRLIPRDRFGELREAGRRAAETLRNVTVLEHRVRAHALGRAARESVRDRFLAPRHLRQYADLLGELVASRAAGPVASAAT